MMKPVGIHDAFKIGGVCLKPYTLDPPVEHDVVKQNIPDSVKGDTDGHGGKIKNACDISQKKKQNGDAAEKNRKQVVFLESVPPGSVMILMKDPKKTVHDIAMRQPGHQFHKTGKKDYDAAVYNYINGHDFFSLSPDSSAHPSVLLKMPKGFISAKIYTRI